MEVAASAPFSSGEPTQAPQTSDSINKPAVNKKARIKVETKVLLLILNPQNSANEDAKSAPRH
jgi:hypothetical protein